MPDYQTEFKQNPITFLKNYALSPPAGSTGDVLKAWDIQREGNVLEGGHGILKVKVRLKDAGVNKKFATFVPHPLFPQALSMQIVDERPNDEAVPIWWLPWESLAITQCVIPAIPKRRVSPSEDDNPRIFVTAGINGCSIFVKGPPDAPTIFHAGIDGKLARPADEFWREQLGIALKGSPLETRGGKSLHKDDYMGVDRHIVQRYKRWKDQQLPGGFNLEVTSAFGSCIGVRYGRLWSFYLQENVYTQQVTLLKKRQVSTHRRDDRSKFYRSRVGRHLVDPITKKEPVTIFGHKVGEHDVTYYIQRTNQSCAPVRVGEIYPTRTFSVDFRGKIRTRS